MNKLNHSLLSYIILYILKYVKICYSRTGFTIFDLTIHYKIARWCIVGCCWFFGFSPINISLRLGLTCQSDIQLEILPVWLNALVYTKFMSKLCNFWIKNRPKKQHQAKDIYIANAMVKQACKVSKSL